MKCQALNKECWRDNGFYALINDSKVYCTLPKESIWRQWKADEEFAYNDEHNYTVTDYEIEDLERFGNIFGVQQPIVTLRESHRLLKDKSKVVYRNIVDYPEAIQYKQKKGSLEYAGNDPVDESSERTIYTEQHLTYSAKKAKENIDLMNWYQFMGVLDDRYTMCTCGLATSTDRALCDHCKKLHPQAKQDIQKAMDLVETTYTTLRDRQPEDVRVTMPIKITDEIAEAIAGAIAHIPTDRYMDIIFKGNRYEVIEEVVISPIVTYVKDSDK